MLSATTDLDAVADASRLGASYVFCGPYQTEEVRLAVRNLAPTAHEFA
jgi:hypothetical protein